jgi:UTP--glucose-1-phosphate uridylyltransferase
MKPKAGMTSKTDRMFRPFAKKMEQERLAPMVIDTFKHYYGLLVRGKTGRISNTDITPVTADDFADAERLSGLKEAGQRALGKSVIIKLNGGLGTSMGLSRAKSLLEVKNGLSFLDIAARQVLAYRQKLGVRLPLVFMNSFNTEDDSVRALASYTDLRTEGIPLSFLQHRFPKVLQNGLAPATWPADSKLEWNPPGHGDIYTALVTSGMLGRLLDAGIRYAFISNSDNLGAVMDETILGYFSENGFPFMMEVANRTESHRKGGHLARLADGRIALREIAQCPEDEREEFHNVNLFKYFNTNTIWVDLGALDKLLDKHKNVIPLSMIRNPKTVDPKDAASPPVYQLETAMGSAISVFEKATAIRVPITRFAPVKK